MNRSKLTARHVASAAPGKHGDGAGLQLAVSKSVSRRWVFRACTEAQAATQTPTFSSCAAKYILAQRCGWESSKHARHWVRTLKTYARPEIGTKPVDAIGTEEVLNVLKPIRNAKTETAKRVQGRIENVLDYAGAHGYRDQTNPARWRGHLDKLLPKPSRVKRVDHRPAMPHTEVPAFMAELAGDGSVPALALRFADSHRHPHRRGAARTVARDRSGSRRLDHPGGADEDPARASSAALRRRL